MSWKLAVAQYIPPFINGSNYLTTLNGAHESGARQVLLNGGEAHLHSWNPGDIVKFGPSTRSTNPGKEEFSRILNPDYATNKILLNPGLTYDYSTGDSVEGVGSKIAEGWHPTSPAALGLMDLEFLGVGDTKVIEPTGRSVEGFGGVGDVQVARKGTNASASAGRLEHSLISQPLNGITYRIGLYSKCREFVGAGSLLFELLHTTGKTVIIATSNILSGDNAAWTKYEATGAINSSIYGPGFLVLVTTNPITFEDWQASCVYMTHAALTDGASAGVYVIPKDPVIRVQLSEHDKSIIAKRVQGNDKTFYVNALNYMPMRTYRIVFDDMDETILRNLEVLQYWQNSGSLLMLETDLANERPLFGFMDFKMSYAHWDQTRIRVDIIFRGI